MGCYTGLVQGVIGLSSNIRIYSLIMLVNVHPILCVFEQLFSLACLPLHARDEVTHGCECSIYTDSFPISTISDQTSTTNCTVYLSRCILFLSSHFRVLCVIFCNKFFAFMLSPPYQLAMLCCWNLPFQKKSENKSVNGISIITTLLLESLVNDSETSLQLC